MKTKKIPLRKCVGCNEMKPKKELIRVVKNQEGEVKVDLTGKANGRGAYICYNIPCFEKAKKTKALNRAFECSISDEVYNKLIQELDKGE
ncbi:RNase P modulator RnpM [Alkaliphilus serpentinus]|uniref:YlxR family protein n=1 Tax=Alkaliphilus serpentinus TaxID=1482731 RepID=A0A833MA07_9FIRM|nr:YlxR family protein [Alkaliphilus serpentinus]KAB3531340.1 YlxR family protein [Alkaliphilus serpentinus]